MGLTDDISDEELLEFKEAFNLFDIDRGGKFKVQDTDTETVLCVMWSLKYG